MLKPLANHWKKLLSHCLAVPEKAGDGAVAFKIGRAMSAVTEGHAIPRLTLASIAILLMSVTCPLHASDQWSEARLVIVVMVDNRFQPDHLSFQANQHYQLHLENHGKEMHEFTAPAFLRSASIRDKTVLSDGGTDVVLQPGRSVDIFLLTRAKGEYSLTCADHDWDGMIGEIVVN